MIIQKADMNDADIVGYIHSTAWKQAYGNVFPIDFLAADTQDKRKEEFLEACDNEHISYYLICEKEDSVGIVKLIHCAGNCEISGFYVLEKYRDKGYGTETVAYLKRVCSLRSKLSCGY